MRENDLIFEYKRDVTVKNYTDRLIDRMISDGSIERMRFGGGAGLGYTTDEMFDVIRGIQRSDMPSMTPENVEAVKEIFARGAITQIEQADPTSKKAYTEWLVMAYINSIFARWEDIFSTGTDFLAMYNDLKQRNLFNKVDTLKAVSNIKQINNRERFVWAYTRISNAHDFYLGQTTDIDRGDAEEIHNGPAVRVLKVNDQKAACYYGRGTQWCTAATRSRNMFDHYNKSGNIYIFIPKKPWHDGEKYQFWAGDDGRNVDIQLMDEHDEPVDFENWDNRFPGLGIKYLYDLEPKVLSQFVMFNKKRFDYIIAEVVELLQNNWKWDVVADWETGDDYYWQWLRDEGYIDDDGDFDDDKMEKDGINYLEFNDDLRRGLNDVFDSLEELTPTELNDFYSEERGEPLDVYHMVDTLGDWIEDQAGSHYESLFNDAGNFIKEKIGSYSDKEGNFKVAHVHDIRSTPYLTHPARR